MEAFQEMNKVAALIVNYNMPERADTLAEKIKRQVFGPCDVFLLDNGSDLVAPAKNTTHRIEKNIQTTRGWLELIKDANMQDDYFAYWFLITSAEFVEGDPLSSMVKLLLDVPNAVGVHPALTPDSTTAWTHIKTRSLPSRRTWMIDNIASLYRADWLRSIGYFDPELIYGWGIDLETCYLARKQGRSLWIDERVRVKKITDIGYTMGRMNMAAQERQDKATENMNTVLSGRYGPGWYEMMTKEYIDDDLR
jgi:hypothetical protein